MSNVWVILAQFLTAFGAIVTILWTVLRERHKAGMDKVEITKTVKQMADESNAWRDTRLWQLEGYLNLDQGWHLTMITNQRLLMNAIAQLKHAVQALGGNTDDINIPADPPAPPPIPEPPVRKMA